MSERQLMEFMPYGSDEEKQRVEEHFDKQRALMDVRAHLISDLMDRLDLDGLAGVQVMLTSIARSSSPGVAAAYWEGIVVATLKARFNLCASCGQDHDEGLRDLSGQAPAANEGLQQEAIPTPIGSTEPLTPWEADSVVEYNLYVLRTEGGALAGFGCRGCSTPYPTIADRKLKPVGVEGCSGCQQKTKFG